MTKKIIGTGCCIVDTVDGLETSESTILLNVNLTERPNKRNMHACIINFKFAEVYNACIIIDDISMAAINFELKNPV